MEQIVSLTLMNAEYRGHVSDACHALGFRIVSYSSDTDTLSAMGHYPPDVLVMQLDPDCTRALHLQERLRTVFDPVCVVYLAVQPDMASVVKAMQLGAVTVLPVNCTLDDLTEALLTASRGSAARADRINETRDAQLRINRLSLRHRQVLERVVSGHTNKAIALQLNISKKTVEKHRDFIRRRTETSTLPELVRLKANADRPLEAAYSLTSVDTTLFSTSKPASVVSDSVHE